MNTTVHDAADQKDPPLTRADVETLLQRNGGSKDLPLANVNLEGANLSNLILQLAKFKSANLVGADLRKTNLIGANLVGADLRKANLVEANLVGADLRKANLVGANLIGANLIGADLRGSDLGAANLSTANLTVADLSSADLREANLIGASLIGADLSSAILIKASLHNANLRETHLNAADLRYVDLNSTYLSGANLRDAIIQLSDTNRLVLHTALSSYLETKPEKSTIETRPFVFGIRIVEEPLTPYHLATVLMAITELSTKCWLIAMNRFADLIEYTQTRDARFTKETQLAFTTITYNSPFEGKFDIQVNATNLAEGLITAIDGVTQAGQRLNAAEVENWEKAQQLRRELDKADQERKRAQLELEYEQEQKKLDIERQKLALEYEQEQKKLDIERERLKIMEMRLDVQEKGYEIALGIATKTVTAIHPHIDDASKGMLLQALIPNILQLQNGTGLELILPSLPHDVEGNKTEQK